MAEQEAGTVLQTAALERVKRLDTNQVMADLKESGITSLEDLVVGVLEYYRSAERGAGSPVAFDTFIYSQFVYKVAMPVGDLGEVVQKTISAAPSNVAVELRR